MSERPIIFSGAMVRAILEGQKTQTRRIAPLLLPGEKHYIHAESHDEWLKKRVSQCPHGKPGDRLWVREEWRPHSALEDGPITVQFRADNATKCTAHRHGSGEYEAWCDRIATEAAEVYERGGEQRWRPSIHMPRWASRITLEIEDVRVQRVQDISEDDARAEGVEPHTVGCSSVKRHISAFADLWDSINAKRGYGWDANPWVWAITFRRNA